jgi:hypothetical protein
VDGRRWWVSAAMLGAAREALIERLFDLRRKAGEAVRRGLLPRAEPTVRLPRDDLRRSLLRHGGEGERAETCLVEAARQLNLDGRKQGEIAAYLIREAHDGLLDIGGVKRSMLKGRAEKVITTWKLPRDEGGSEENLEAAVGDLELALANPNEERLENAIRSTAHRKPQRGDADLIKQFLDNLEDANKGLHRGIDRTQAAALYERTVRVIDRLFGPISDRFDEIDLLLAISDPTEADVSRLAELVGDDRHLNYFFEKVEGSAWMRALAEERILQPPTEGGWPAGSYIFRLVDSDPDVVREWLVARGKEELSPQQAGFLLRIASRLDGVAYLIADLSKGNLDSPEVEFQLEHYLSGLSDQGLREPGLQRLVIESLKALLSGDEGGVDLHLAARILEVALNALRLGDQKRWLQALMHRLRDVAAIEDELRLRAMRPLPELSVDPRSRSGLELIAAAVRDGADQATAAGLAPSDVVSVLEVLEEPLRARLVADYLRERGSAHAAKAQRFLLDQIGTNPLPSPEELQLLHEIFELADGDFGALVREALGAAPSAEQIDQIPVEDRLPDELFRPHRWLVAVPEVERGDWQKADRRLSERFGAAPADGVIFRVGAARFGGASSPIPREDLALLEPEDAARRIAAWEPPPESSFLDPSAEGLAGALTELIAEESTIWLAADPRQIVVALRAPRYVSAYLDGIEKVVDQAEQGQAELLVQAIADIQSAAEAAVGEERGDGEDWVYAAHRGNRLIRALEEHGLLGQVTHERAWEVVMAAVRFREPGSGTDGDPLTRAINRPWSSALETAILLADRDGSVDPRLLELFEEVLALEGDDAELGRAIIATRLPWIRHVAPEWFANNEEALIGNRAPDGLGDLTFATYLEWGRPEKTILTEQRERVIDSLRGAKAEFALRHLLHGLAWGLEGFGPADVADILAGHPALFSEAARTLGIELRELDGPSAELDRAIDLWREALGRELPAEAYGGWGWFSINEHLDDSTWLNLSLQTAARERVNLAEPEEIAERAERLLPDPRVLRLVSLLLDADPKAWELEQIGAVGLRLLGSRVGDQEVRNELRERLLERGFHDAREIP